MESVRGIFGNDLTAESRLDELELFESQARDASVIGVFDEAILAVRGAKNAVEGGAMFLDLEMNAARGLHSGYTNN